MEENMKIQGFDHAGNPKEWGYTQEMVDLMIKDGEDFRNGNVDEDYLMDYYESVAGFLNDVGVFFNDGVGVTPDIPKAVWYYEKAIELGEDDVVGCNLGDIYRKGAIGVEKDLAKALEAYESSNHPYAIYRVGEAYEKGWGTAADLQKAVAYYKKSAQQGHRMAIKRCKELNIEY